MGKASAYGAGDCKFESCRGQTEMKDATTHPHSCPRLRGVLVTTSIATTTAGTTTTTKETTTTTATKAATTTATTTAAAIA